MKRIIEELSPGHFRTYDLNEGIKVAEPLTYEEIETLESDPRSLTVATKALGFYVVVMAIYFTWSRVSEMGLHGAERFALTAVLLLGTLGAEYGFYLIDRLRAGWTGKQRVSAKSYSIVAVAFMVVGLVAETLYLQSSMMSESARNNLREFCYFYVIYIQPLGVGLFFWAKFIIKELDPERLLLVEKREQYRYANRLKSRRVSDYLQYIAQYIPDMVQGDLERNVQKHRIASAEVVSAEELNTVMLENRQLERQLDKAHELLHLEHKRNSITPPSVTVTPPSVTVTPPSVTVTTESVTDLPSVTVTPTPTPTSVTSVTVRRCEVCNADISHRAKSAKTCGGTCRNELSAKKAKEGRGVTDETVIYEMEGDSIPR